MRILRHIEDFLIHESASVPEALRRISANKHRVVFVVASDGTLRGALSDGDVRRAITAGQPIDESVPCSRLMNSEPVCLTAEAGPDAVQALFRPGVDLVPLVDGLRRVTAVASSSAADLWFGRHQIAMDAPTFIIAEIGNNHNGDLQLAKRMVDLAQEAGADCVKFQMRHLGALYKGGDALDKSADLGAQYTLDVLRKFQLSNEDLLEVFDHCKLRGLSPLCTPWDAPSLEALEAYGMEGYKVASADLTNHEFLRQLAATGKPLICSTGMSTEAEIRSSIELLDRLGAQYVLLHCNSTYPTPYKDVNLRYLGRLAELSGGVVGYSGHERGIAVPTAAVALGARVIEKHFTVDKSMEGADHKVSLLPAEFAEMVRQIRAVEESLGSAGERALSQGEMINRESLAKSIVAVQPIAKGAVITRAALSIKSPGQGLQPMYMDELVGRRAIRDVGQGDYLYASDLKGLESQARQFSFKRPFGIPVRYHDYPKLKSLSNLDFVEFHLSYQDMEIDPASVFHGVEDIGLAVHSPELFAGDHILDLASESDVYRQHSIAELNRVCDITRKLKGFFPKTDRPVIVVNAGGFNASGFLPVQARTSLYQRVVRSLAEVDQRGVEIIIQTMPPFPWHFGGQSYHNLFMDPAEIARFCAENGYRICYDVSHSMMSCNYFGWKLHDFTEAVAPYIAHMHVVDASGWDGEGVQIGKGDVDFGRFGEDLTRLGVDAQFIPEVWQGHKNAGEGFWSALNYLERYL